MVHNRACPICGKVVSWTMGKLQEKTMPDGSIAGCRSMRLICPKHGEFEPRVHERLDRELTRVMKEVSKE